MKLYACLLQVFKGEPFIALIPLQSWPQFLRQQYLIIEGYCVRRHTAPVNLESFTESFKGILFKLVPLYEYLTA